MQLVKFLLSGLCACAFTAQAGLPDYQAFPAMGEQRLLWVASEHGRAALELRAAQKLAAQGVEVWSLDLVNAYFLPQLPGSMDDVPVQDLTDWLQLAQDGGKRVTVLAVARAAIPVLRAAARLDPARRNRLCVLLMYPNLYTVAEPLAEPAYLEVGICPACACACCSPAARPPRPGCPACWTIWRSTGRRSAG